MHKYLKMCSLISCHVVCIVDGHKVSAFLLRKIIKVSRCPLSIVGASCDSLWRGNPMVRFGIAHARGESGKEYSLLVYPWGTNFKKGFGAVYFVTNRYLKKDGIHVHGGIHVGQTEDLSTEFHDHHKQSCFDQYKANCVCIHEEEGKDSRSHIVQDLIDKYNPPCTRE